VADEEVSMIILKGLSCSALSEVEGSETKGSPSIPFRSTLDRLAEELGLTAIYYLHLSLFSISSNLPGILHHFSII
jgi:transcriptional regulator with XRE-family HTH domain